MNRIRQTVSQLWHGDIEMRRAFWDYAIIYGSLLNLATTVAAFVAYANGAPLPVAVAIFLTPLPYNLLVVLSVWRSAERYTGPQIWANLARVAVVIWAVIATTL